MELKGKAVLITGGARVGEAVAEAFAVQGCHVAMTYHHSRARVERTAARVRKRGVKALLLEADVRRSEELERLPKAVEQGLGRLDVLVNMASVYDDASLADLKKPGPDGKPSGLASWDESLAVEARSAFWLAVWAAPALARHGAGRIVNFSDWLPASGRPRYKDHFTYYVGKGAVKSLTEMLALELAPRILVNAVAPGPILPPDNMSAAARRAVEKEVPAGRWGGPPEIARTVIFLAQTDFITGECLRVDGGRHLL